MSRYLKQRLNLIVNFSQCSGILAYKGRNEKQIY